MKLLDLRCPACGGVIDQTITSRTVTCEYCGSRFALDDDEADAFIEEASAYEEASMSSISMADFAASACSQFLANFDDGSLFRNTPKILRGLGVGDGEDVFLIHDDTLMKSGKNGFAITERGLYCRELAEKAIFVDWAMFADLKVPREDGSCIACGNRNVCYFTDDDDLMPELEELYVKLQEHAKRCP